MSTDAWTSLNTQRWRLSVIADLGLHSHQFKQRTQGNFISTIYCTIVTVCSHIVCSHQCCVWEVFFLKLFYKRMNGNLKKMRSTGLMYNGDVVLQKQSEGRSPPRPNHRHVDRRSLWSHCFEKKHPEWRSFLHAPPRRNILVTKYMVDKMWIKSNVKSVIASNINVFRFIMTIEMLTKCVLHFTKAHSMLKETTTEIWNKFPLLSGFTVFVWNAPVLIVHIHNKPIRARRTVCEKRRTNKNASIYIHCMYQILA